MTPFWNGASTFWNSNACRDFEKSLNYTYPEFAGLSGQSAATIKAKIGAIVNQLYGSGTTRTAAVAAAAGTIADAAAQLAGSAQQPAKPFPIAALRMAAAPAAVTPPASGSSAGAQQVLVQVSGNGTSSYLEWSARIHAKKFELNGSYSVLIFIGSVPDDPQQWRTAPSYVGAHHVFANSQVEDCANCRENRDESVEGFVELNDAIAAKSGLHSFDLSVVEPYLKNQLHWRVQKVCMAVLLLSASADVLSTPQGRSFCR